MAFTEKQMQALTRKLNPKHVRTRVADGKTLSYVEGWHVIAEANRIFKPDAWDRETIQVKCVWEGTRDGREACTYMARVRIRVRAGDLVVVRMGSGTGHGIGPTRGEAHEFALKTAETDAMKRALATFGNPFGLALYDKEQRGVRKDRKGAAPPNRKTCSWTIYSSTGERLNASKDPTAYCAAVRKLLYSLDRPESVKSFWKRNSKTISQLQSQQPDLISKTGRHYSQILDRLYKRRLAALNGQHPVVPIPQKAVTPNPKPSRTKDPSHLKYVASRPCLVCGSRPAHAHHILYAQPRALSRKVGDEWTVPLCPKHHQSLHNFGNEGDWWKQLGIDPLEEARRLRYLTSSERASPEYWQKSI